MTRSILLFDVYYCLINISIPPTIIISTPTSTCNTFKATLEYVIKRKHYLYLFLLDILSTCSYIDKEIF